MNKIKFYRQTQNLTIRQLSEKSTVAISYISTLENDADNSTNPSKTVMENIADALGQTVPDVFFPKEKKEVC